MPIEIDLEPQGPQSFLTNILKPQLTQMLDTILQIIVDQFRGMVQNILLILECMT